VVDALVGVLLAAALVLLRSTILLDILDMLLRLATRL